jgi:hypothetical protein
MSRHHHTDIGLHAQPGQGDDAEVEVERPPTEEEVAAWVRAACEVRANPALRENMLQTVLTSMAQEGFHIDRARAEQLLDRALDGPPLIIPDE